MYKGAMEVEVPMILSWREAVATSGGYGSRSSKGIFMISRPCGHACGRLLRSTSRGFWRGEEAMGIYIYIAEAMEIKVPRVQSRE